MGVKVADAAIAELAGLSKLTLLHLRDANISAGGLVKLRQALPELQD